VLSCKVEPNLPTSKGCLYIKWQVAPNIFGQWEILHEC
jgi:hypothetical protein